MRRLRWLRGFGAVILMGCGGNGVPKPTSLPPLDSDQAEAADPSWDTGDAEPEPIAAVLEVKEEERPEPKFTKGMSVNEAIRAVPSHYDHIGIDPDALGKPLRDPKTYKGCNLSQGHFRVRVAIWDGVAVGVDVDSKSQKLAACVDKVIRKLTWPDKEKSINTIDFSY